jgi:hypothetical protein
MKFLKDKIDFVTNVVLVNWFVDSVNWTNVDDWNEILCNVVIGRSFKNLIKYSRKFAWKFNSFRNSSRDDWLNMVKFYLKRNRKWLTKEKLLVEKFDFVMRKSKHFQVEFLLRNNKKMLYSNFNKTQVNEFDRIYIRNPKGSQCRNSMEPIDGLWPPRSNDTVRIRTVYRAQKYGTYRSKWAASKIDPRH